MTLLSRRTVELHFTPFSINHEGPQPAGTCGFRWGAGAACPAPPWGPASTERPAGPGGPWGPATAPRHPPASPLPSATGPEALSHVAGNPSGSPSLWPAGPRHPSCEELGGRRGAGGRGHSPRPCHLRLLCIRWLSGLHLRRRLLQGGRVTENRVSPRSQAFGVVAGSSLFNLFAKSDGVFLNFLELWGNRSEK